MSDISKEEISHLAALARLELSEQEIEAFATQLPAIIGFVEQLKGFQPSSDESVEVTVLLEHLRLDEVQEDRARLTIEDIKKLAPQFDASSNQVVVPAVFGEKTDE